MKSKFVVLECITNMHVGNGDVNYSVVDNEVEKDPITELPVINSSGVKGALREYFSADNELQGYVNDIFGSDKKADTTQGKVKFLTAEMLTMPARATKGDKAFYLVTSNEVLERFNEQCELFLHSTKEIMETEVSGCSAEEIPLTVKKTLLGKNMYIVPDDKLKKIPLPVLARNVLDNGKSKNLWYEEIVPHGSVFYFPVVVNDADEELLNNFANAIKGKIVQFGGNASIGYGLCKVSIMEE